MNSKRVIALLLTAFCSAGSAAEMSGKVLNYGIFEFRGTVHPVKTPGTPSGFSRPLGDVPTLLTATNRIPARIGIRFGMFYEINNLPLTNGELTVTIVYRHPPMTSPDGTVSSQFNVSGMVRVNDSSVFNWTGFTFDHLYELLPGRWQIEVKFGAKTICEQEFFVFKEQRTRAGITNNLANPPNVNTQAVAVGRQ